MDNGGVYGVIEFKKKFISDPLACKQKYSPLTFRIKARSKTIKHITQGGGETRT